MKTSVLLAAALLATVSISAANAQNTSKIVTPPTAAESTRMTTEGASGAMKEGMKAGEGAKDMKEMKEMKEKAKEAEGHMKKEKMK